MAQAQVQENFFVSSLISDGSPVVIPHGALDVVAAEDLHDSMMATIAAYPFDDIFIDLRDVSLVDSTGLNTLIGAQRECRAMGGELVLVEPSPGVRGVLDTTRVSELFRFVSGSTIEPHAAAS